MTTPDDAVQRYQRLTRELLVKRALGLVTLDDEAETAELLDDIWRELSQDEQHTIETWLEAELATSPNPDEEQRGVEVEADDVRVAPRSAA